MIDQSNIPVYNQDHDIFKQMSAKQKMSMKDLFHEWVKEKVNGDV